jgi:DNA-binding transcriptional LysR family regulator
VELAELIDDFWILPPPGTRFGSIIRDMFGSSGLPYPRAGVVSYDLEMTVNLLRTGRYLAIHNGSVLGFPSKHPLIRKLPVELPSVAGPVGILTLRERALSPAAQLFIECVREIANTAR